VSVLLYIYISSVTQYSTEKFTKTLLGESEIESVLQRLDRLTQDEARISVAQTLGVVHSLVGNVRTVLAGTKSGMICSHIILNAFR
jgi:hypothetical protein